MADVPPEELALSRGVFSSFWLRCLALAALTTGVLGCNLIETRPTPRGPNVLIVTIDTLRADYVGAMTTRTVETPTLDRLAREGTLFENASATAPLTLPSHTSILTGQYPPHHGVRHNSIYRLPVKAETLAERFQAAGYTTAAFVAAAVLGEQFGLAQGFDEYHDEMSERLSASGGFPQRSATEISEAAIEFLARTDRPFMLWLHYYDAHASYEPPEPYRSRLAPNLYAGEVAYVDHELGRVLEALRKSGRGENTIVLATADHGEGLGEHGEGSHSYLIYESTMHIPLLVRGPGVPSGKRVTEVVSNASVAPTLLALASLPPLADADVADLTPLMRGEQSGAGWAYSESLAGQLDHGWAPIHAIRSQNEKFIQAPRPELFDLAADPHENANLLGAGEPPYAERLASAQQRIDEVKANEAAGARVAIDAETRARIEALGYVVPSGEGVASANAPDPKDVERYGPLAARSGELMGLGRWAEAEAVTLQAIEKLPGSATLRENLARIYLGVHRKDLALEAANEAVRLAPDSPWSYALLGEVRIQLGDHAGGVAAFERALALNPKLPGAHFAVMSKLRFGGSLEDAEAHAKRGLALGDYGPGAVEACGEAWEQAGEYERAIATYQDGIARAQEAPERLHMRLAIQYARLGDEEQFEEHIALSGEAPRDLPLATRLAIVWAARKEYDKAEPLFRALVMRDRTHAAPRMLAHLLRQTGRAAEADRIEPAFEPALRLEHIPGGLGPSRGPRG